MKIGVDAGCLGIVDKNLQVGVYQVVKNLFVELGKIDTKNEYLLYSFLPIEKRLLAEFGKNVKNVLVHPTKGWMKIWLPLQIQKDKPDIFLGLSQALPSSIPFLTYKTIGFVYDIAFDKYPEMYPDSHIKLQRQTSHLVTHTKHIITISQATKNDVIKEYSLNTNDITVCYPGVRTLSHSNQKKVSEPEVNKSYFLFVGALKKIKNVSTIIKAFSQFLEKSKKEYELYLIGGSKWYDDEIDNTIRSIPPQHKEKIKFCGFITDEELSSYYKGATAFVSPSLYEGFGLPFVEAMASGCPVIGSTAGAIPEIVGDAGILVDPLDVAGVANAMERVAAYTSLRLKMKEAGIKRSKQFTWENFTKGVLDVINTV